MPVAERQPEGLTRRAVSLRRMGHGNPVDRVKAQTAVRAVGSQVVALLRSASHPSAPALGAWDLTDLSVHLSNAVDGIAAMAQGSDSLLGDLSELPTLTEMLVAGEGERDLGVLAERIEEGIERFLGVATGAPDDVTRPWLVAGIEFPLSVLTCHMLNELVVHGHDLALADGVAWPIDRDHAALVLQGFLFPAMDRLGRSLVDQRGAAGLQACFEIRLRGDGRVFLRIDDGLLTTSATPDQGRVDCHLSVDPVAFLLVAWGRSSQWPEILRGRLFAWGRRPWLGVRLRSLLRNP